MNNFLSKLLLTWTEIFPPMPAKGEKYDKTYKYYWVGNIMQPISIVLYVLMGLVAAAGAIYAIYLGIQLARADEQGKRDEAKKHLITVLIAVAITVVFILFFNMLMPLIVRAFLGDWKGPDKTATDVVQFAFKLLK